MPTPPEIEKPFATPDERRAAHAEFIRLGELVQQINSLPDEVPSPAWLAAQLDAPLLGIQESVPDRLKRFRELFTDEMAAVGEAGRQRATPGTRRCFVAGGTVSGPTSARIADRLPDR